MRRILVICSIAALGAVAASVAAAAQPAGGWSLTESTAERILMRDVTVRLAPSDRVPLEDELRLEIARFRALELSAVDEANEQAMWTYNAAANRYFAVLQTIRRGLGIEDADCTGTGRSLRGHRFERFHCLVTSEVLSIPSTELDSSGGGLPTLIEGESRIVGPLVTQYRVRVMGKSRLEVR